MRPISLLLLTIPLGGCLAGQKQQVARCSMEGQRVFTQGDHPGVNDGGEYITLCMKTAGYEFSDQDPDCQGGILAAENPSCYVPADVVSRYVLEAELAIKRLD